MEKTRLIMLEGLPGTGKSTNAYFLYMQLGRNGRVVEWAHEVANPHPVLAFNEASLSHGDYALFLRAYPKAAKILNKIAVRRKRTVGIDLFDVEWRHMEAIGEDAFKALQGFDVWNFPLDRYMDVALEKWAHFAENAMKSETDVYILDSALFQYQIFTFLLQNAPFEQLSGFIDALLTLLKPLNPSLIYFYWDNVEDTIRCLEQARGTGFLEQIWQRDKNEPYYADKPQGTEGHKCFLRDYAAAAKRLFDAANCRKLALEITGQDWIAHENTMLSFINAKRRPNPTALPHAGVYENEALGLQLEIDGLTLIDPSGRKRLLTPKSDHAFYVDCLPVILQFDGLNQITMTGGQICERWTTLGTRFIKI